MHALPVALFDYTPGSCDSTITFTSQSIDTASAITTMYWNFGDGTLDTINAPNTSTTHKYTTAGTYVTTLTVVDGNGCTSTVTDSIQRSPCIVAAYTPSDTLLCQNYALSLRTFLPAMPRSVSGYGPGEIPHNRPLITAINPSPPILSTQPGTFLGKLRSVPLLGQRDQRLHTKGDHGNRHPYGRVYHTGCMLQTGVDVYRYHQSQWSYTTHLPLGVW
ncbi:MAG: PKD domain-containing protein [Bacteroidales bacterium]|nr:PKD domain-containing protein [Bacteroidales bacterium]